MTPAEAVSGVVDVSEQRIVVAVDLSEHSEKTASYAIALAKSFQALIMFVHVFPAEPMTEFRFGDVHWSYSRERDAAKERLVGFGNKMCQVYPRCETQFRVGDMAEELRLAAVTWNADLVVTACYDPGFLGDLLQIGASTSFAYT